MTGRKDIELLIDPTLLLTQNSWEKYFNLDKPIIQGNYIFYYAFHYSRAVNKTVMQIAEKTNMPVYIIEARAWGPGGCKKDGIQLCKESGPIAFLNLMKYANMVLTTSFHGTVFSVIFRKNFWFIDSDMHNAMDDRASTLLDQVGLPNRLILGEKLLEKDFTEIPNYKSMDKIITELQNKSISFLNKNLS